MPGNTSVPMSSYIGLYLRKPDDMTKQRHVLEMWKSQVLLGLQVIMMWCLPRVQDGGSFECKFIITLMVIVFWPGKSPQAQCWDIVEVSHDLWVAELQLVAGLLPGQLCVLNFHCSPHLYHSKQTRPFILDLNASHPQAYGTGKGVPVVVANIFFLMEDQALAGLLQHPFHVAPWTVLLQLTGDKALLVSVDTIFSVHMCLGYMWLGRLLQKCFCNFPVFYLGTLPHPGCAS